jgi:holo-[acyl-carrier protein] synthase
MISIGTDIESIKRFDNLLHLKPKILQRFFSDYEWNYANKKNVSQTLTGIWCAKEAVVKAFSSIHAIDIRSVYISHHKNGEPFVEKILGFKYEKKFNVKISISHSNDYAVANCLAFAI